MQRLRSVSAAARCTAGCSDTTSDDSGRVKLFRKPLVHERRVQLMALAGGFPGVLVSMIILLTQGYSEKVQWTLGVHHRRPLARAWRRQCASAWRPRCERLRICLKRCAKAITRSVRATHAGDDAMGEVMQQVNAMGTTLRAQRLGALEATTLLRKVMEEIDVAMFAFDAEQRLRLVNRAGEKLLGQPTERILEMRASELGLADSSMGEANRPCSERSRAAPDAGESAAVRFAKADCRISCSSLPI